MASRTLQISEKDIRQERRIVWPSFDVCKGRNYSKGNKFYLRFPPLQKPEWRGFRRRARVSERKRRIQLRVCLRRTCPHSRGRSEAMPLRSPGDAATSLIAEADTGKCQSVKVSKFHCVRFVVHHQKGRQIILPPHRYVSVCHLEDLL